MQLLCVHFYPVFFPLVVLLTFSTSRNKCLKITPLIIPGQQRCGPLCSALCLRDSVPGAWWTPQNYLVVLSNEDRPWGPGSLPAGAAPAVSCMRSVVAGLLEGSPRPRSLLFFQTPVEVDLLSQRRFTM